MKTGSIDPEEHYDEVGAAEWGRLEANFNRRQEFENTTESLKQRLPDSGRVLDAGCGAGRYAVWLAERDYDVTMVDISNEQVDVARQKVDERGLSDQVRGRQSDVRDLPFEDDTFDAVCSLGGVLSHVVDESERQRALSELRRVAREDAPIFVSVMGRLSMLRDFLLDDDLDDLHELLLPVARTGDYTRDLAEDVFGDQTMWVECHFFRVEELESELERAGLTPESFVGLEGLTANFRENAPLGSDSGELDQETLDSLWALGEEFRHDRVVADMSEHILAVSRPK